MYSCLILKQQNILHNKLNLINYSRILKNKLKINKLKSL